ncbi:MAG: glycosyltransferase family 2 protein [Patescibacteria group bacterium]
MKPTVSIIIPVYKVERVLADVLASVYSQTYPIEEIILVDNHSPDGSVAVAKRFVSTHKKIPIRIIERKRTYGLCESYNLGAKFARTTHIVTIHSDGLLPTKYELGKLILPFIKDPTIVAAGPKLLHRMKEWLGYNFWQKCLFAGSVGKEIPSGNGKFDCFNRKEFLKAGGFDTKHFSHTLGSEDIDMHLRLRAVGRVVNSKACVIHAHPAEQGYTMMNWIARRKFLSLSYGRYLQLYFPGEWKRQIVFFIKPLLALISLLGFLYPLFFLPIFIFPFLYMPIMFREPSARSDPRIFLLPFILILLVFYESFWMTYSFLFMRDARYNTNIV